ncbi:DoxX family protein [Halomarina salina]|uniref:DoxX family protein n=1 Tax=Halomarina salina TaxID=1872699 RepID=A0ABD5RL06_9EURY|nr:DoxX family protein [Halomarina salina]
MATATETDAPENLDEVAAEDGGTDDDDVAPDPVPNNSLFFRLARLLFGAVLVYTGLTHFRQLEGYVQYADAKGIPEAETMVPLSGGLLVSSGLGIAFWKLPKLAAGAAATFLVVATPTMHDFWNADEESKQTETNAFLKNVAMLGGALAFLVRAGER